MFSRDTDKQWEKFGREDAYFGVIAQDKYKMANLNDETKEEFFRTGQEYVDRLLREIKRHLDPGFTIRKALDFGCGVGRVVIPLAKVAKHVTGADVSESMLREAQKNCESRGIENVNFVKSDDDLSLLNDRYDFIHSLIVFQHIPVKRGERILKNLMTRLEEGGCAVLHFTYEKNYRFRRVTSWIRKNVPLTRRIVNIAKGKSFFTPEMQMNAYDLNRLFLTIQKFGADEVYTKFSDHNGDLGVIMYFQKRLKQGK